MHILAATVGLLFLAFRLYLRLSCSRNLAASLVETVADAPKAVRRYRFRRKANVHPVEAIDDPSIAVAALGVAHVELELIPSQDHWDGLKVNIARVLDVSGAEAEELMVLGRWLVAECGTVDAAVARLSRKLYRMAGPARAAALHGLVQAIVAAQSPSPNGAQADVASDVARFMHIRG